MQLRCLVAVLARCARPCGPEYPCTPDVHCVDGGEPECEAGYEWQNEEVDGDFRCVPIATGGGGCPQGQERLSDGTCAAPCASDRLREGTLCVCPADTV